MQVKELIVWIAIQLVAVDAETVTTNNGGGLAQ